MFDCSFERSVKWMYTVTGWGGGEVGGSNLQSSFSVRRHRRLQIPPRVAGAVLLG